MTDRNLEGNRIINPFSYGNIHTAFALSHFYIKEKTKHESNKTFKTNQASGLAA